METEVVRGKLLEALARADEGSREERAERIEWLAQYTPGPGVIMGEMVALQILEEAKASFVSGHFVGALLLATAFVEQTLSEELEQVAPMQERSNLAAMINSARCRLNLRADLLDQTDRLRVLRNPYTHRKAHDHPHSLGRRFLEAQVHPTSILEKDAQLAMGVMYEWFHRTLRRA